MEHSHPIDRVAIYLRKYILWAVVVAAPITVISYPWLFAKALDFMPEWLAWVVIVSNVVTLLSIASLIDIQRERRQNSTDGQS